MSTEPERLGVTAAAAAAGADRMAEIARAVGSGRYLYEATDEPVCGDPFHLHYGSCYLRSISAPTDPEPQPSDGPDYHADHQAWESRRDAADPAPTDPDPTPPASTERLYGLPGAERLHLDLATCYETDIDPYVDEHGRGSWTIEEWSVRDPVSHLPAVDRLVEWVCECAADDGMLDEYGYDNLDNASRAPDVREAFEAAIELLASKLAYRMADELLASFIVTWDGRGEPLVNGTPLYADSAPTDPAPEQPCTPFDATACPHHGTCRCTAAPSYGHNGCPLHSPLSAHAAPFHEEDDGT